MEHRMPEFSSHLARTVAARHGNVTRNDLLADGLSVDQIRRMVRIMSLVTCHTGTYRVSTAPDTFESRCAAACLTDPTVVVTGRAAASLWSFRHVRQPDNPIVLVWA
jgi:hypothetical protein